jgi:hypothetical protein
MGIVRHLFEHRGNSGALHTSSGYKLITQQASYRNHDNTHWFDCRKWAFLQLH